MNSTLVVVRPFGTHAKGDAVSDAAAIAQILASEHAANVVRVFAAHAPTPAPAAPSLAPSSAKQGG